MSKLEFKNVSKVFEKVDENDKTHALKNINLSIENNEFVSIVGPSGCGKSTMLRLISGLIKPSQGSVYLDGEKIKGPSSKREWYFKIQHFSLG